jgi:hypothetical protein
MTSTKIKLALAAVVVTSVATPFLIHHQMLDRLRIENDELRRQLAAGPPTIDTTNADDGELLRLRGEHQELLRLRDQVSQLRRERDELRQAATAAKPPAQPSALTADPDAAWIEQVLNSPPAERGKIAGVLRAKQLRGVGGEITASDRALQDALLRQDLNTTLERSPSDFAAFQAAFIQAAIGLGDEPQVEQIRQVIHKTYEQAVAQGLDIPSKPTGDSSFWVTGRHRLDRQATAAVQQILSQEERQLFDRAFLGVMGADLGGVGVDKSNYPPGFFGPDGN